MDSVSNSITGNGHELICKAFEDERRRLSTELQLVAAKLIIHLNITSLRVRIEGTFPEIYITIGGGRHTDFHNITVSQKSLDMKAESEFNYSDEHEVSLPERTSLVTDHQRAE